MIGYSWALAWPTAWYYMEWSTQVTQVETRSDQGTLQPRLTDIGGVVSTHLKNNKDIDYQGKHNTVWWCHHNVLNLLLNSHNRHPIAHL